MYIANNKKQASNDLQNAVTPDSEDAFRRIYDKYAGSLYAFGLKFNIEEDLVQDAIQEVFVDLFLKSEDFQATVVNMKAYLFVALKNNLLKKLIRKKRFPTLTLDVYKDLDFNVAYDPQEQIILGEMNAESKQNLQTAIKSLSKKQKEIIYLKFEEELDYPDVARVLQISIESARKQLYRALKSLRESLNNKEMNTLFSIFSKKS